MHKEDMPKYYVRGYTSGDPTGQCDDEVGCDTLADAKKKARQILTDEYTVMVESTVPVLRATVTKTATDECVISR